MGPRLALRKALARPRRPKTDYMAFEIRTLLTTVGTSSIFIERTSSLIPMARPLWSGRSGGDAKSASTSPHMVSRRSAPSLGELLKVP
jgi:hypothetical protein